MSDQTKQEDQKPQTVEAPEVLPFQLVDARKKEEDEYIAHAKKMFDDNPDLWKDAIIVTPDNGVAYPGHLSQREILGALVETILDVYLGDDEEEDGDQEDDDD